MHIWIDRSGVSNPDPKEIPAELVNTVETFCNSVAAEVLVPHTDFLKSLPATFSEQTAQSLAAKYRVSTIVMLRRAYELNAITRNQFFTLLEREQQKQKERDPKEAVRAFLSGQSCRSTPVPTLPHLPILVKVGIESEAEKVNRAAQDVPVTADNRMSLAGCENCRSLLLRAFIECHQCTDS